MELKTNSRNMNITHFSHIISRKPSNKNNFSIYFSKHSHNAYKKPNLDASSPDLAYGITIYSNKRKSVNLMTVNKVNKSNNLLNTKMSTRSDYDYKDFPSLIQTNINKKMISSYRDEDNKNQGRKSFLFQSISNLNNPLKKYKYANMQIRLCQKRSSEFSLYKNKRQSLDPADTKKLAVIAKKLPKRINISLKQSYKKHEKNFHNQSFNDIPKSTSMKYNTINFDKKRKPNDFMIIVKNKVVKSNMGNMKKHKEIFYRPLIPYLVS